MIERDDGAIAAPVTELSSPIPLVGVSPPQNGHKGSMRLRVDFLVDFMGSSDDNNFRDEDE